MAKNRSYVYSLVTDLFKYDPENGYDFNYDYKELEKRNLICSIIGTRTQKYETCLIGDVITYEDCGRSLALQLLGKMLFWIKYKEGNNMLQDIEVTKLEDPNKERWIIFDDDKPYVNMHNRIDFIMNGQYKVVVEYEPVDTFWHNYEISIERMMNLIDIGCDYLVVINCFGEAKYVKVN